MIKNIFKVDWTIIAKDYYERRIIKMPAVQWILEKVAQSVKAGEEIHETNERCLWLPAFRSQNICYGRGESYFDKSLVIGERK